MRQCRLCSKFFTGVLNMSRSYVSAFRAMTAAMLVADGQILGPSRTWHGVNGSQKRLLQEIFPVTRFENHRITGVETDTVTFWVRETLFSWLEYVKI